MSAPKIPSYRPYVIGFILSLIFTLAAYILVEQHVVTNHDVFPRQILILTIFAFALAQLIAQLIFFLHLNRESKPHWNLIVMSFAVLVVGIVVIGSLWIMQSLNYRHPVPASSIDDFIIHDEGYIDKRREY